LGFFLDIYVEYLVRVMIRPFRASRGRAWPTERARITSTGYRPGGFGCAVADLTYKYSFGGELYTGTNANPFIMTASAKDFIEHYSEGDEIMVRVDPQKPESSVLLERDQCFVLERSTS
jgi:hypothetical protein